ncbi:hypothetical protein F441_17124 [Phytophthora nicotianae CJ01A1]|uniref:Uncharacterized protein n=2 Tax=Phytophthora nicotianae TaxID=4792 RepID=W2W7Q2_PHYNI|nr:hypothetical protein L915_16787 [Phytophthora nicotianae]ETP06496.1 hypothetical protein F441_17124 [Phytophthora nicotianae CJ01A1]
MITLADQTSSPLVHSSKSKPWLCSLLNTEHSQTSIIIGAQNTALGAKRSKQVVIIFAPRSYHPVEVPRFHVARDNTREQVASVYQHDAADNQDDGAVGDPDFS